VTLTPPEKRLTLGRRNSCTHCSRSGSSHTLSDLRRFVVALFTAFHIIVARRFLNLDRPRQRDLQSMLPSAIATDERRRPA